ncbi:hypothetical protein HELRODRAFT_177549 [Helobdella robusta]|uniref:CCHC-type domain-containing protein n=1 Tax=Helobdella robusta TaxID=6412 RepID=T1FBV2_HELRO|nr:hypothetical protein HELRODRAFT_177549 [Helobdella robusta]ESN97897.1 hypothetical protein HELRODRAFT_177549 [Helobdella robusta]
MGDRNKCYNCGKPGHMARDCKSSRTARDGNRRDAVVGKEKDDMAVRQYEQGSDQEMKEVRNWRNSANDKRVERTVIWLETVQKRTIHHQIQGVTAATRWVILPQGALTKNNSVPVKSAT